MVKDLAEVYDCLYLPERIISSLPEAIKKNKKGMLNNWMEHVYNPSMDYDMNVNLKYQKMTTINFEESPTAQSKLNVKAPTPVRVPIPVTVPYTPPAQEKDASGVRSINKALPETQRDRIYPGRSSDASTHPSKTN